MTFSHLNRFLPKRVMFNVKRIFVQFTEDLKTRSGDTRFLKSRVSGNGLIVSFQWKVDGPIIQMLRKTKERTKPTQIRRFGRNYRRMPVARAEVRQSVVLSLSGRVDRGTEVQQTTAHATKLQWEHGTVRLTSRRA